MTTLHQRFERAAVAEQAAFLALCQRDLGLYMEFVHEWKPRPHQVGWVRALQALEIAPDCWGANSHPICECSGDFGHVCDACFTCRVQRDKELLIVAFVGSGKSDCVLEYLCWSIGRNPEMAQVGLFSYNDNIATERSMLVRDVVWSAVPSGTSERFAMVFPGIRPASPERPWSQERWFIRRKRLRKDPTFVAAGVTGSVNARRIRRIVLDDPQNKENSDSEYQRRECIKGFNLTVKRRSTGITPKICITPRWSGDEKVPDLAGYFIQQGWATIRTPALDDNDKSVWEYEPGIDEGFSTALLLKDRARDPYSFALQLQAIIVPEEGGAELRPARKIPAWQWPQSFKKTIQVWDTAEKQGPQRSETVGVTLSLGFDDMAYIRGLWSGQPAFADLINVLPGEIEAWLGEGLSEVLIEEKSSGTGLLSTLRRYSGYAHLLRAVQVGGRGRTREEAVKEIAAFTEYLRVPYEAPWADKVIQQLLAWGSGSGRDDIVMALTHGLKRLYSRGASRVPQITFNRILAY